jgi:hypothetical protein
MWNGPERGEVLWSLRLDRLGANGTDDLDRLFRRGESLLGGAALRLPDTEAADVELDGASDCKSGPRGALRRDSWVLG